MYTIKSDIFSMEYIFSLEKLVVFRIAISEYYIKGENKTINVRVWDNFDC